MARLLTTERACREYYNHVLGLTNWAIELADRLESDEVFTADYLMRLHFDRHKISLERLLNDRAAVAAFEQLYPQHAHLIAAGRELCDSFSRLHTVRQAIICHHARPDGCDVHNHAEALERVGGMSHEDVAGMHGLNVQQLAAWQAQTDQLGFVYLSSAERATLRDAILAEFA